VRSVYGTGIGEEKGKPSWKRKSKKRNSRHSNQNGAMEKRKGILGPDSNGQQARYWTKKVKRPRM